MDQGLHTINMDESIARIEKFQFYEGLRPLLLRPSVFELPEQPESWTAVNECHVLSRVGGVVLLAS